MIQTTSIITDVPSAYVTVNRNRVKTYGEKIYLKDGTQFEIELWNPLTTRVLAVISIDGKPISENGIVLNPGQRIPIERWVDGKSPRKFKFSTYEVENSTAAMRAIADNGRVKVSFYTEIIKNFYPSGNSLPGTIVTPSWSPSTQPYYYYDNTGNVPFNMPLGGTTNVYINNTGSGFGNASFTDGNSINLSSSSVTLADSNSIFASNVAGSSGVRGIAGAPGAPGAMGVNNASVETGRVEQGDISNQMFTETTGDFNTWPSRVWDWQILPESTKPLEAEKIRYYCECGTRVRASSWKWCPSCGEKLQ